MAVDVEALTLRQTTETVKGNQDSTDTPNGRSGPCNSDRTIVDDMHSPGYLCPLVGQRILILSAFDGQLQEGFPLY